MNKKSLIIVCAAVAFILGEVWVNVNPSMAPLVVFLALAAGLVLGFFFKKILNEAEMKALEEKMAKATKSSKANSQERKLKIMDNTKPSNKEAAPEK